MLVFATTLSILSVATKFIILKKVTKNKKWNFPFIPVIFVAFIISAGIKLIWL
jgi:hypothetical protein